MAVAAPARIACWLLSGAATVLAAACTAPASAALPDYVPKPIVRPLAAWLRANPGYAVMTDADCHCDEDLQEIRTSNTGAWRPQPSYHPYFTQGDFNGDGSPDAAIAVTKDHRAFLVLVIDGGAGQPYLSSVFKQGDMLFFGAPRARPWRLLVGHYQTDTSGAFLPKGRKGYVVRYEGCC